MASGDYRTHVLDRDDDNLLTLFSNVSVIDFVTSISVSSKRIYCRHRCKNENELYERTSLVSLKPVVSFNVVFDLTIL